MKVLEGEFDSDVNMGMSGGLQDKQVDMGDVDNGEDIDDNSRVYREVGSLSVLVAHGILGRLRIDDVMNSDQLSDNTKESIQKMIDDMGGGIQIGSGDENDSSDIDMEPVPLQEMKKRIKANFDRFL